MTTLGNGEYPEMTFSEALRTVEGIRKEKATTTAALSKVMGLNSSTTGYFYQKLAALNKFYGLIEKDKSTVTLTPQAKRIVYPISASDRATAIRESILRVPLIQKLYSSLGNDFHDLDFPTRLLELTKASHEELAAKSQKVEVLYRDAVQFLRGVPAVGAPGPASLEDGPPPPSPLSSAPKEAATGGPPSVVKGSMEDFWTFQSGDSYVRIKKKDKTLLKTAKKVIDAWLYAEGESEEGDVDPAAQQH